MRRDRIKAAVVTVTLAIGFLCAVGMAAGLVVSYIAPYVSGVDV